MNCERFDFDVYAWYVLGTLEGPDSDVIRVHLQTKCAACLTEIKEAVEFWYVFATLSGGVQHARFWNPSPALRRRVLNIAPQSRAIPQFWMRAAAATVIAAASGLSAWKLGQFGIKRELSETRARVEHQIGVAKTLESENNALRNLVLAARNTPAVFPGRDNIVSVPDPYMTRDLQKARQTQAAMSDALNGERAKTSQLEQKLSENKDLLAAEARQREDADQRYVKAYNASIEKDRGVNRLSSEIAAHKANLRDLQAEISLRAEQHAQLISLLQSRNMAVVRLRAVAPETARAVMLVGEDAHLALFAENLAPAPAGRTYQIWLGGAKGQEMVSAGVFNSSKKNLPCVQFIRNAMVAAANSFLITEEPAGGSTVPTGRRLMSGTVGG